MNDGHEIDGIPRSFKCNVHRPTYVNPKASEGYYLPIPDPISASASCLDVRPVQYFLHWRIRRQNESLASTAGFRYVRRSASSNSLGTDRTQRCVSEKESRAVRGGGPEILHASRRHEPRCRTSARRDGYRGRLRGIDTLRLSPCVTSRGGNERIWQVATGH